MNIKLRKSQGFGLALPIVFASAFGGCATRQTPMQTAEAQVAQPVKTQPIQSQIKVQKPRTTVNVKKLQMRQVYAGEVLALQFSHDGKTLASAGQDVPTSSNNSLGVKMLNTASLTFTHEFKHLRRASLVAFSPNLKRVVTSGESWDDFHLFDAGNGKMLWSAISTPLADPNENDPMQRGYLIGMAISPSGDQVAALETSPTGTGGGESLWRIQNGEMEMSPHIDSNELLNRPLCTAFSPDGKRLFIGAEDRIVVLCSAATGKLIWEKGISWKPEYKGDAVAVAWSPDGRTFATAHRDNSVSFWDAANGQKLRTTKSLSSPVPMLAFSPDDSFLAIGQQNGNIVFSSTGNGAILHVSSSRKAVTALAFAPDGKHLAAGYADGKIALWRLR